MLEVLKEILPVHSTCYTFLRDSCISIRQSDSDVILNGADFEPPGLCFWLLVPEEPQILVIEDLLLDARCLPPHPCRRPPASTRPVSWFGIVFDIVRGRLVLYVQRILKCCCQT